MKKDNGNKKDSANSQGETDVLEAPTAETTETPKEPEPEMVEKEKYMRLYADFENFKKRAQKEQEDFFKTANQKTLLAIIPTLDNFERAGTLDAGLELVYTNLKKTLEGFGLKETEAKGLDFDSDKMDAISHMPAQDETSKGKVFEVVEKGYELHGKIIRYAKVVVWS